MTRRLHNRYLQPQVVRLAGHLAPLCCLLVCVAGCQQRASTSVEAQENPRRFEAASSSVTETPNSPVRNGAKETWDVVYVADAKIGFSHTTHTRFTDDGRPLLKIENHSETTIQRFGDTTTIKLDLTSIEAPDGRLVRFQAEQLVGPNVQTTTGRYENGQLRLETTSLGKKSTSSLNWDAQWGGFFAYQQSLTNQPLQPGEIRRVHCLLPVFHQPGVVYMKAANYEDTPMVVGTRRLLKIDGHIEVAESRIDQTLWTDVDGEILKTYVGTVDQTTFRTTKEVALGKLDEFDLGQRSLVKVSQKLEHPHATQQVLYRAHLQRGSLAGVFAEGATQIIRQIDPQTVELTVNALTVDRPANVEVNDKPTPADLAANNLIQSDDREVRKLAGSVAVNETDHGKIALELERTVHRLITKKGFSQAFATAAEVAQSREGDCTEHAVLLAAMCRARQIPARVAIGLVYVPTREDGGKFAYHMWTETWIADRWLPLDATLGQGGIGAAHIKISSTNLKGAGPYSAFLPVVTLMGHLQLEILETR